MSFDTASNPFGYKTPTRHQDSLVGILGKLPIENVTPIKPSRDNRQGSVSPIRQEESANLENRLAKTINGQIFFKSEFSDSPFLGGKKNYNFTNKSLLSSDVLTNPAYEPVGNTEKRPQYRPGSQQRKKDRELSPNIARPINYSYLTPHKDPQKKEGQATTNEVALRNGDYNGVKTPLNSERSAHLDGSPAKFEINLLKNNRSMPGKNESKQVEGAEKTDSPAKEQRGNNHQIDTQLNLRDSPQKAGFRNQSAQNGGHFVIDGGARNKSQKIYRFRPGSSIHQEEQPVVREIPYYLKRRALNKSATDLTVKPDANDEDFAQGTPRKRDLTPNNMARTSKSRKKWDFSPAEKQKASADDGINTPLSQRSQVSDISGKDLICHKCVNNKMCDMKKEHAKRAKEEALRRGQQISRITQQMTENEEQLKKLKKEEGRKVALANKETILQNEQLRAENRKNLRGEPIRHLDKIFEGEESRINAKREKSVEFRDAVREQISQKKMEKEKSRGAEKSPEFGNGLTVSEEGKNPKEQNKRDLSSELRKQIEEKEAKKKEVKQREVEKSKSEADKISKLAQDEQSVAIEKKRLTKEQLKNALEQAIEEKQSLNDTKKSDKAADRENIDRSHAYLKQVEEHQKRAKREILENHMEGLKNQIFETKQNKEREREKSKELYDTSINGIREHSPDFIQNHQANKSAEKGRLRENLMEQMVEKKRGEKEKRSENAENATSLPISGVYTNPYINNSQPLSHSLEEQIYLKNSQQEQTHKEDKELARQKNMMIAQAEEELQRKTKENERKMRKEYREALAQDVAEKSMRKDQARAEKQKDLEVARTMQQDHQEELNKGRVDQDRARKIHKEALDKQTKDNTDNRSRGKSEGRPLPAGAPFSNDTSNRNNEPKLYSCIECTQKFPKQGMTKKRIFE